MKTLDTPITLDSDWRTPFDPALRVDTTGTRNGFPPDVRWLPGSVCLRGPHRHPNAEAPAGTAWLAHYGTDGSVRLLDAYDANGDWLGLAREPLE